MIEDEKYQALLGQFRSASTTIRVLPVDTLAVEKLSQSLTFNPRSYFGIVLTHTGGIVIDNWVRIYGSGELDFVIRNQELADYDTMIVAEDITGGLFAMTSNGELSYFAPDFLEWEKMEISYGDFLQWITEQERLDLFYETVRFPNWEAAIKAIKTNEGIGYFPFLWAKSEDKERHRELLPILEIQQIQLKFVQTLGGATEV